MLNKLLQKKDKIIDTWIKLVDIELDEAELRYQFSKLFDDVVNLLEEETPKNIEEVVHGIDIF